MGIIQRQPATAADKTYDIIIIGGGVYGVMLSFEASRRGLKSLLLEKDDFGGATTFNFLRILHGGFRYLQTFDFPRFRESVAERRWFMKTFPDLVKPLPCLMPLYGNGLRRTSILRIATWINNALSYKRNQDVPPEKHLPAGKIMDVEQTQRLFPSVDTHELQGAVVWYDAAVLSSERLVMEILRWACGHGATALNYVEAIKLLKNDNKVFGIEATDLESGQTYTYRSEVVVNTTGPWCRNVASCFDKDESSLFRSSLAWNVLFDRDAISSHALAVTPRKPKGRTYFLLPWKGKLLAGTGHAPWSQGIDNPIPSPEMIQDFLSDLNMAVPSLGLKQKEIFYVFAGLLPAAKPGTTDLADREVILKHADHDGPKGFYSISGVKFTTARLVAEKALKQIFPQKKAKKNIWDEKPSASKNADDRHGILNFEWHNRGLSHQEEQEWRKGIRLIAEEESVRHLDDLVFRRTSLWDNPKRVLETGPLICELLHLDKSEWNEEIERLKRKLHR